MISEIMKLQRTGKRVDIVVPLVRQLSRLLQPLVKRAKEACDNSGYDISDHSGELLEMVDIRPGARRNLQVYKTDFNSPEFGGIERGVSL